MRVAVLLPNWVGDVVMATPTLRALRNHYARDCEIAWIMRPVMADLLAGTGWCDRVFYCDRRSGNRQLGTLALAQSLRKWRPHTLVLLTNSLWAAAVAWLSGASQRVGYARNGRRPLLTTALPVRREGWRRVPVPASEYYLQLAYALGCGPEELRTELATLSADEAAADRIWRQLGLDLAQKVIVFNTGSAVGTAKSWPPEYFAELARRAVARRENAVLIICGPGERDTARQIERAANHPRVKSLAGQELGLGVSKACVRRSQLMVTTDSGPRHFALAFEVPVVTLFGPTDPRWIDSRPPLTTNLSHPVECSPCGKSVCPYGHQRCMRELTVDRVDAVVQRRLAEADRRSA